MSNVSGRQRMLSERSALLCLQLVFTQDKNERESLRSQLQTIIELMEKSHNGLIKGDYSLNLSGKMSARIKAMYFEPPLHYLREYPHPSPQIQKQITAVDVNFIIEDLPSVLSSMKVGTDRICGLVRSLLNFSRSDRGKMNFVNIHDGIENTLLILQNRLKANGKHPGITVIKDYANLMKRIFDPFFTTKDVSKDTEFNLLISY